jgi:hypothetical protein
MLIFIYDKFLYIIFIVITCRELGLFSEHRNCAYLDLTFNLLNFL